MLKAQDLSYSIDGKFLLNNVHLTFTTGILYGILGPNGSGKSTFLKTLSGIWKPTNGTVLWQDQNLQEKSRKEISQILTLVPQNPQVSFDFNTEEIVIMSRYPHGGQVCRSTLEWSLRTVNALHLRKRRVNSLSNGERQRVYIARALMSEAPVLLLDEPTSCLDIRHQIEIWKLLKDLARQGKTVIAATHDLHQAERFCDHIAVLNQGSCLGCGRFSELITPHLLKNVFHVSRSNDLREFFSCESSDSTPSLHSRDAPPHSEF